MKKRQSAALERRKFFADPVLVATIALLIVLLTLFILYPLTMLLLDSIYVRNTNLIPLETVVSGEAELSVKEKNGETLVRLVNNKGKAVDVSMEELSTAYGFL